MEWTDPKWAGIAQGWPEMRKKYIGTTWNDTAFDRNTECRPNPVLLQLVRHNPSYPSPFRSCLVHIFQSATLHSVPFWQRFTLPHFAFRWNSPQSNIWKLLSNFNLLRSQDSLRTHTYFRLSVGSEISLRSQASLKGVEESICSRTIYFADSLELPFSLALFEW